MATNTKQAEPSEHAPASEQTEAMTNNSEYTEAAQRSEVAPASEQTQASGESSLNASQQTMATNTKQAEPSEQAPASEQTQASGKPSEEMPPNPPHKDASFKDKALSGPESFRPELPSVISQGGDQGKQRRRWLMRLLRLGIGLLIIYCARESLRDIAQP